MKGLVTIMLVRYEHLHQNMKYEANKISKGLHFFKFNLAPTFVDILINMTYSIIVLTSPFTSEKLRHKIIDERLTHLKFNISALT